MTVRLATILLAILLAACGSADAPAPGGEGPAAAEYERGPHRGRMLRKDDFALEVTIFESGVPPEYRLYGYKGDQPIAAEQLKATIEIARLDGEVNRFGFAPQGDALVGDGVVTEPHSFDVTVTAQHAGNSYRWRYASHEGRTTIPASVAQAAGVRTRQAGPATIHERIRLMGRVALNADRHARVRARFEGPVREVRVALGDAVVAGQTLAVVENRDSLRSFAVMAPFAGRVLARHTNVGDVAGSEALFEIADLSTVWVELHAFGADAERLAVGQAVRVRAAAGDASAEAAIDQLLPQVGGTSQALVARVTVPNPEGRWRPGMAIEGEVTVGTREVPLAVERIGLQRFRDFTVVFARVGETYEVRMVELGEQDEKHVEVLGGLKPGTEYVAEQSFLIKADVEKSGASHDH